MYKTLSALLIFTLLVGNVIFAQDTIVVQTFTLSSDERTGVFDFPDDPNQSYEKVLMTYQMRCHDAQVGSGNVGCREWDYSCNTFITDSTRVDSNRAVHPTHTISNFNEPSFNYTLEPNYSYTQYEQKEIVFTNTMSENIATIEDGNFQFDLAGNQAPTKIQVLYKADELSDAGLNAGFIRALRLKVMSPGDELSFLRVKMKATSKTSLNAEDPDLDGFTEVYFLNTLFTSVGDHPLNFYTPFEWDGNANILVEFSFISTANSSAAVVGVHNAGFEGTIISGEADRNLHFAGSGTIPLSTSELSSIDDQITISFWSFGTADVLPVSTTVLQALDADGLRQANVHLPWANGQVYWDCGNDGSGYDRINLAADPSAWEGKWNHWAFTKNANTGVMAIYLNGSLFHSGNGKTKPIDIDAFNFASNIPGNLFYYGAIDDLQIWDVALDQSTIQTWMRRTLDDTHPNVGNLQAYFPLNEGSGIYLEDFSFNGQTTTFEGAPSWNEIRGKDIFKGFASTVFRPNIDFVQGDFTISETTVLVLDSVLNNQHQITEYGLDGTDLVTLNNFFAYAAGTNYVYDEAGMIVDSVISATQNTINIGELEYFNKFPAKYEILSLVTPYGNNLDLGPNGKTFTFDVSDYLPILNGKKRMSIEMGGQNQEELDIKFLFIKGTPPRQVMDIQNVWPFRRGNFGAIQEDDVFEPREVSLAANGSRFKIRSSITGHGQNGEFVERMHYLNINGGANEFEFPVWKTCGSIPIYPQGGTWLFNRAGWCPGDPTTVNHWDITDMVNPGTSVEVDYGLIGAFMEEANYLVAHQLVTYGEASFSNDAAVIDVIRPSKKVEHERFNPACNLPMVTIRNTGSNTLTSLDISYQVQGGEALSYTWTGSLEMMETTSVELPVDNISFWQDLSATGIFEVSVSNPNGAADEYGQNNKIQSEFNPFTIYEGMMNIRYKTNNRPEENHFFITDAAGEIVLERNNMEANTTYSDDIALPGGCYTLHMTDTGGDGLSYWYWAAIGANVGTGFMRMEELVNGTVNIPVKSFEPEFGDFVQFDFYLQEPVSTEAVVEQAQMISLYPNPTADEFNLELSGFENTDVQIDLFDAAGKKIQSRYFELNQATQLNTSFNLKEFANGLYMIRISDGLKTSYKKLVKS